ncbi:MAG TPA: 3-oxoacyl-ACP reductase family protein [bacterium]|nr:3-oxoacyl-ACP reductase family protein [bacterium]
MRPRERVVVVTGASRGIGRAIAQAFAREGSAIVVNAARSIAEARAVADAIVSSGGRAAAVQADVGDPEAAQTLVARTVKLFGRVDVLVNNAGFVDRSGLWQIDEERWSRMMAVHVTGPFFASRAAAQVMLKQGGGSIINIASMRGIEPGSGPLHYSVSKAAVLMLTKCLARDLAPHVRVNAIAPGYTETSFHADRTIAEHEQTTSRIPLRRFARPEEVARAAVFLASDGAAYMTGHTLVLSGGVVMA